MNSIKTHATSHQPNSLMHSDAQAINFAKAFYLSFFLAISALLPFLVLYYEQLGLNGQQIGLLTGVPPLVTLFSAALWGGVADATRQHQRVLITALCGILLVTPFFLITDQLLGLLLIVIGQGFFTAPALPLVDNAVLTLLGDQSHRYGKIRLWGAIGFGISPPIIGYVVEASSIIWAFGSYLFFMGVCIWIARQLPMRQQNVTKINDQTAPISEQEPSFWHKFKTLISNHAWLLFLVIMFIAGMSGAVAQYYLFLYMNQIGASETLMGTALTVAMVGELTLFLLSEKLLKRFTHYQLLLCALLGHSARLILYSYINNPWLVLPLQLLHCFSFALLWITAVEYAKRLAPPGMGATAQGMLNSIHFGIAAAIGSFIGGYLYQQVGPHLMFRWAGLSVLAAILLLIVSNRQIHNSSPAVN